MLNSDLGAVRENMGREFIETRHGVSGHAVYGPYSILEAGRYGIAYSLRPTATFGAQLDDVCATVDVSTSGGRKVLASKALTLRDFVDGASVFHLEFELAERSEVEFRVGVNGAIALEIDHVRRVYKLKPKEDVVARIASDKFPDFRGGPNFFQDNFVKFRNLYELGLGVSISDDKVVLEMDGVKFYATCHDDMNFIGEIFFERAYNIEFSQDVCVIDVGMNIGLASLQFATKPFVREIHAFEPFESTYDRAKENLAINPDLAKKIAATNAGIADKDTVETFMVRDTDDSGARSTRNVDGGIPVKLKMLSAATALRPIVEAAKAKGMAVLAKIDCEGAEYAIFESLEKSGLLSEISAFVVEWHGVIPGKSQETLIRPLRKHGFTVIDRSPRIGQGVFYAVKAG